MTKTANPDVMFLQSEYNVFSYLLRDRKVSLLQMLFTLESYYFLRFFFLVNIKDLRTYLIMFSLATYGFMLS